LYSLSQQDLYRVLAQRPEVGRHLLASLARRLRKTNESLADLVFADVPVRVAKNVLDLAQRFGRQKDDGVMVAHGLTQAELAQLVGASRQTANKALADFASRGWIRLEARAGLISDVERLRRRARGRHAAHAAFAAAHADATRRTPTPRGAR